MDAHPPSDMLLRLGADRPMAGPASTPPEHLMRTAALAFLLTGLLLATAAPKTQAQVLDGEWFKLTASADGTGVGGEPAQDVKGKLKTVVRYARFLLDEGIGSATYTVSIWDPTESGEWLPTSGGSLSMLGDQETFCYSGGVTFSAKPLPAIEGAPNIVSIEFNGPVKIKIKNKELKSAKISSLGALAYFTNDDTAFFGRAKLSFTRIPESKLPFVPDMISLSLRPTSPQSGTGTTGVPQPVAGNASR